MAAWRYEISLLVLKKYFTRSLRSLVKYFSTLEEKFRISARPCNILYLLLFIYYLAPNYCKDLNIGFSQAWDLQLEPYINNAFLYNLFLANCVLLKFSLSPLNKIGSLRKDVFERHASTGSEAFSPLMCLDATKCVFLRVISFIETICLKIWSKSRPKNAKGHFSLTCVAKNFVA